MAFYDTSIHPEERKEAMSGYHPGEDEDQLKYENRQDVDLIVEEEEREDTYPRRRFRVITDNADTGLDYLTYPERYAIDTGKKIAVVRKTGDLIRYYNF